MLSKVWHYVPTEELKSIYYAIFLSHMVYGCQIWGQHLEKISKLQNRALQIINFKDFNDNANPLYTKNNILKLQDLIRLQNCLFVHDYLNGSIPACFKDYYFKLNYLYFNVQTRNANLGCLFSPGKNTTKYGLNSITQKSINSWNYITKSTKTNLSNLTHYNRKNMLTRNLINHFLLLETFLQNVACTLKCLCIESQK